MYCTKCGIELGENDRFCSRCGNRIGADAVTTAPRTLMLDKRNKKIAGVCAGFARYFDMDVVLMRVVWLAIALCTGGLGFLVYLAAWIVIPSDGGLEAHGAIPHATQTT
ncbi:MAG: PspC domain-containing protein [Bryobacteraceae bacterium]|jgi:phage shock protein C